MTSRHQPRQLDAHEAASFSLEAALEEISHWLPAQGPLKNFIHHNTLHAFQDHPFHEGLALAEELYGSRNYLELGEYRRLYREGSISDAGLKRSLEAHVADREQQEAWRKSLFETPAEGPRSARSIQSVRRQWLESYDIDLARTVHPLLFRLISNFLDQGLAIWSMPHAEESFWDATRRVLLESFVPLNLLRWPSTRQWLKGTAEASIVACLDRLVGNSAHYTSYLLDMTLAHPGWSGMVHIIEKNPQILKLERKVSLRDLLAVELVLEYAAIAQVMGESFEPLHPQQPPPLLPPERPMVLTDRQNVLKIWQEAWEWTYYLDVLQGMARQARKHHRDPAEGQVQAFFCIDDREGSLRRHLEELDPTIRTWSAAGFFGIDFLFKGAHDQEPTKLCPVPVKPQHLVHELPEASQPKRPRVGIPILHPAPSNTLVRGWLLTHVIGLWHSIKLALLVFKPSLKRPTDQLLSRIEAGGELKVARFSEDKTPEGHWIGYSLEEMADRVQGVLKSSGCMQSYSPLMIMIAHGASSVNNPYFSAYDCGACSGRPGAPNARAFAKMANNPGVRVILAQRGLIIPDDCIFVGAFHDTTRDEIHYFRTEHLPPKHKKIFDEFQKTMELALKRNAKERCRRFELAPTHLSMDEAYEHVRLRATSIFEPRPELNHATNALCVVGRRTLTQGLFLDRRAFLNSYDPTIDPTGQILAQILAAVVPVVGGINLEYYFSRVDPEVYGAGSKLPQNVVGLIGVAHGVEGDLLTGLPIQMTEMHDPLRLMLVIEQSPNIVLKALSVHAHVSEWTHNEWVRLACITPETGLIHVLEKGEFIPLRLDLDKSPPQYLNSLQIIEGKRKNIPVHAIAGAAP